jgi:hypothetical protein
MESPVEPLSDTELLRRLLAALSEGKAEIEFSPSLQSHLDFAGNSETDKSQFIFAALVPIALAYWTGKWWLVTGAVVLAGIVYFAFWRKLVRARIRRRFIDRAMRDLALWRRSWGLRGIVLKAAAEECRSPECDWRAFAARLIEKPAAAPDGKGDGRTPAMGADGRS